MRIWNTLLFMSLRSCCRTTKCEKKNPIDFEKQWQQKTITERNNGEQETKVYFVLAIVPMPIIVRMRAHALPCICTAGDNGNAMYKCTLMPKHVRVSRPAKIDGICIYYTYFSRIRITYEIWTFSVLLIFDVSLFDPLSVFMCMFCFIYQPLRRWLRTVLVFWAVVFLLLLLFIILFPLFDTERWTYMLCRSSVCSRLRGNRNITNGYYDKCATEILTPANWPFVFNAQFPI